MTNALSEIDEQNYVLVDQLVRDIAFGELPKLESSCDGQVWRYRQDLDVTAEGLRLKISDILFSTDLMVTFDYRIKFKIGDYDGSVFLQKELLERIMLTMAPDAGGVFSATKTALLIEFFLSGPISEIERITGHTLRFSAIETWPGERPETLNLYGHAIDAVIAFDQVQTAVRLHLCTSGMEMLEILLKKLPTTRRKIAKLPISVGFEIGHAALELGELRLLEPGDAVLPIEQGIATDSIIVTVAGRAYAEAKLHNGEMSIVKLLKNQEVSMSNETSLQNKKPDSALANFDEMEINLTFEIGRMQMTLAELETIAPGYVFKLDRELSGLIDVISGGRRIGRGSLVEIGDRVGVRLLEVYRNG